MPQATRAALSSSFDHLLDLLEHVLAHLGQLLQNDGIDLALLGGGGGQRAETRGERGDERGGAAVFGLAGGIGDGLDIFLQRLVGQTLELDGDFLFFCHNGFLQIQFLWCNYIKPSVGFQ